MIKCHICGRNTDALLLICVKCKRRALEEEREISDIMEETNKEFED